MSDDTIESKIGVFTTDLEKWLPHREPFLFVDRVEVTGEKTIKGLRKWKGDEFFFKGHFPGFPVVPGVILVETLAQAGGVGVKLMGIVPAGTFFFATLNNVKFRKMVRPGDEYVMEIENLKTSPRIVKQRGTGYVNGEVAVEAEWMCVAGEEA